MPNAVVGSSRIIMDASAASALAISTICCSATDNPPSMASTSMGASISARMRAE
jgi:hypothetical protein